MQVGKEGREGGRELGANARQEGKTPFRGDAWIISPPELRGKEKYFPGKVWGEGSESEYSSFRCRGLGEKIRRLQGKQDRKVHRVQRKIEGGAGRLGNEGKKVLDTLSK